MPYEPVTEGRYALYSPKGFTEKQRHIWKIFRRKWPHLDKSMRDYLIRLVEMQVERDERYAEYKAIENPTLDECKDIYYGLILKLDEKMWELKVLMGLEPKKWTTHPHAPKFKKKKEDEKDDDAEVSRPTRSGAVTGAEMGDTYRQRHKPKPHKGRTPLRPEHRNAMVLREIPDEENDER